MPSFNLSGVSAPSTESPPAQGARNWSPQQKALFEVVEQPRGPSIQVTAVAGSGKTTSLVEASRRMPGTKFFGAFNKRIADEIKERTAGIQGMTAGTMHSIGLRSWKATAPECTVDAEKLDRICDDLSVPRYLQAFTRFMVSGAKQGGWKGPVSAELWQRYADHHDAYDKLPDSWDESRDPFEYCNIVLAQSVSDAEHTIDFDDMIYMPLLYGHIEQEYDWVLVDEAQDTNWVRRQLVRRLLRPDGRVVAVGDPHQAIYGFTGADADAMALIASDFGCEHLPLTVTYRCPKSVVAHAQQWVSHIQAADSAPEGSVTEMSSADFGKLSGLGPNDVILCRYTKPLVTTALSLIRRGVGARVEGREIGQALLTLAGKWKSVTNVQDLAHKVEEYAEKEAHKFQARGQAAQAAGVRDKTDSLLAVIDSLEYGASIYSLRTRINQIFGDTKPGETPRVVTLSTVHKAKGREWDRVLLLGRAELMPSKYAKQEWELEQEKNLIYVAVTRAKKDLVEVEYYG